MYNAFKVIARVCESSRFHFIKVLLKKSLTDRFSVTICVIKLDKGFVCAIAPARLVFKVYNLLLKTYVTCHFQIMTHEICGE